MPEQQPSTNRAIRPVLVWARMILTVVVVQVLGGFVATSFTQGMTRAAVFLVVVPSLTLVIATRVKNHAKTSWLLILAATCLSLGIVHVLREQIDGEWFLGPLPSPFEFAVYATVLGATALASVCVLFAFSQRSPLPKLKWFAFTAIVAAFVLVGVGFRQAIWDPSPTDLIHTISVLEKKQSESASRQDLSVTLAMCGREHDAEWINRWRVPSGASPMAAGRKSLDLSSYQPRPWRQAMEEIARRERLIVIMEAHNAPKHRRWIEQTLSVLHQHGFRDYAAEGLMESGRTLKRRGYPVATTGFYVSDPQFGNLLRKGIELGFNLHNYEAYGVDFNEREQQQAANLSKLFSQNPDLKLVVHAGYAHVYKTPRDTGEKLMAGHLWSLTGVEPYTIYQTWHGPEEMEAKQLAGLIKGDEREPIMLVPAPNDLESPQFDWPDQAIDALVVHKPSEEGPAQRVHEYPGDRRPIRGEWKGDQWPVVVAAYKSGEPTNAIALDQVMLLTYEQSFVLWIPENVDHEIRVFGIDGLIDSAAESMLQITASNEKSVDRESEIPSPKPSSR